MNKLQLVWIVLITVLATFSSCFPILADSAQETAEIVSECEPLARILTPEGINQLINPDMRTMAEVKRIRSDCLKISTYLKELELQDKELTTLLQKIKILVELHLLFNSEDLENMIISLSGTKFEVLKKLHRVIQLPLPPGFAFIRIFSKSSMPSFFKLKLPSLDDEEPVKITPGKTIMYRYITVDMELSAEEASIDRFIADLSHELVHVYINALLGTGYHGDLPKWFEEGCALYFAGNKPVEVTSEEIGDYSKTTIHSLTKEYKEYLLVFQYLNKDKEKSKFSQFVTEAIKQRSVEQPLKK